MIVASIPLIITVVVDISLPLQKKSISNATKLIGVPGRPGSTAPMTPMTAKRSARITSRMSMILCLVFVFYVAKVVHICLKRESLCFLTVN